MIVVDERDEVRHEQRYGAIQRMGLPRAWLCDPAQWQVTYARWSAGGIPDIAIEQRVRPVGTRVRRDQYLDLQAFGTARFVEKAQCPLEQFGAVVRCEQYGERMHHGGNDASDGFDWLREPIVRSRRVSGISPGTHPDMHPRK